MTRRKSKEQAQQQPYTPVQQFPWFEVRYYPEAIFATIYTTARTFREITAPAFKTLADYIFGGNDTGQRIAMTAPVYIEFYENGSSMSFVMPSEYEMEDLPNPMNPHIKIERAQPGFVAAITFGGYASDEKIIEESEKLRKYLKKNNIEWTGSFRFLGYSSPTQHQERRNEVAVSIIWE